MKKLSALLMSLFIMFSFSGCTGIFSSPASLMSPPKSSGNLVEIEEALSKIKSDYQLSYPSNGNYRNAIIIRDLNNDGNDEAVVFYQTSEKQTITVHMNVLTHKNDDWISKFDVSLSGTGIDRIEFADVCGDEAVEILVGSKLFNNNEQELSVYKYEESEVKLLAQERYTDYCVADLGASVKPQIVFFKISDQSTNISQETKDGIMKRTVNAKLVSFSYESDPVAVALGSVDFDSSIVSFSEIKTAPINDNQNGIFVDAFVSDSAMITEVFYYDETLKTTFYNAESKSTTVTYRDSLIGCRDINKDGKIELPKTFVCQGYDAVEGPDKKVYFSEWYSMNGQTISDRCSCGFLNTADNYYIATPASWIGKITAQKDLDIRERIFYEWDFTNKNFGEMLFKIRVFLKSDFEKDNRGYTKIKSDNEYIYAAKVNTQAQSENKVTLDYLKNNITLL